MRRLIAHDSLSTFTNEEIETTNKQSHQYLREEYIGEDKAIYVTESAYDVASRMKASKKSLRILRDRHLKLFFVCDVDDYIHNDMAEAALEFGYYDFPRWKLDEYLDMYGRNVIYYIYAPKGLEKDTYGSDVGEDGYEGKYVYSFDTVTTRSDDRYKASPLARALGKYDAHYIQDGWTDDYTPKIKRVN